jgi:hypothetical protein
VGKGTEGGRGVQSGEGHDMAGDRMGRVMRTCLSWI